MKQSDKRDFILDCFRCEGASGGSEESLGSDGGPIERHCSEVMKARVSAVNQVACANTEIFALIESMCMATNDCGGSTQTTE